MTCATPGGVLSNVGQAWPPFHKTGPVTAHPGVSAPHEPGAAMQETGGRSRRPNTVIKGSAINL